MKLFVYYSSQRRPYDIHAIEDLINTTKTLCTSGEGIRLTYQDTFDKQDYLDTTRPFCKTCNKILKKKGIDMKQLAINQKLGVR